MKIVLATPLYAPDWEWGGVVTWAAQLFPALVRRGHDVIVVTTCLRGSRETMDEEREGVRVMRVPGIVLGSNGRIGSPGYEAACRKNFAYADIVHIAGVWQPAGQAAVRAARAVGVPYGISPHGALGAYAWTRNRLLKMVYYQLREKGHLSHASWIHATSALEEEELRNLGWSKNVHVVANPLDTNFWIIKPEEGAAWRSRLGMRENEFVLLSCGRLHHKKGLELLLGVFTQICGAWKWVVIGDDQIGVRKELQAGLRVRGLENRVVWLDAASPPDVRAAYAGSDCLLMPSHHENFGNVAVEASACGCRALVSEKTGAAEWLEDSALPRETAVWAREISRLIRAGRDCDEVRYQRSSRTRNSLESEKVAGMFEAVMAEYARARNLGGKMQR